MAVEDMRDKASMRPKPLTRHCVGNALFLLRHVANMVSLGIHDNVFICLLKATRNIISFGSTCLSQCILHHDIHHFQLSLNDDT